MPIPKRGIGSFDSSSIPVANILLVTKISSETGHCYGGIDVGVWTMMGKPVSWLQKNMKHMNNYQMDAEGYNDVCP
eukprot:gene27380-biopygen10538